MEITFDTLNSPAFQKAKYWLGISALLLAAGAVVIFFTYYGRARDVGGENAEAERWILLMGTFRDSLLITLLYAGESLVYRNGDFAGMAAGISSNSPLWPLLLQPVASMLVAVLVLVIASLRVVLITRWLARNGVR
ncbi:hypothetical protein ACFO5X_12520 [Seohaeicola nanhaiensis]|uniref:Uncharacterized protein n=1 Tax=Seohaeicola nanhaiensis TaxID=1387282 RepID=A0ABV9KIB8_9RHOB